MTVAREEGGKRRQIIDGARRVFLDVGFDAASMNEVARVAGVSKGTLYVYFASKEELFAALLRDEKGEHAEQVCRFDADGPDIRANLQGFGERFMKLVLRPDSMAHFRTVMAVCPKFPEIGRAFFEAGPQTGHQRLARYLAREAAAGTIDIDDAMEAAQRFFALLKGDILLEVLLCMRPAPETAELEAVVAQAVTGFLRIYALRP